MDKELELFAQAAEQLNEVKAQLHRQLGASERIRLLSESIGSVADELGRLPKGLTIIAERAETAERRLSGAADRVQELRDAMPSLVQRLADSDYGRAVDELLAEVGRARAELASMQNGVASIRAAADVIAGTADRLAAGVDDRIRELTEAHAGFAQEVAALRQDVIERVQALAGAFQELSAKAGAGATATATAYSHLSGALKSNSERLVSVLQQVLAATEGMRSGDISALRAQLADMQVKLDAQSKLLNSIASKKGIFFG